jgi:outer membrane phospholipase A
MKVALAGLFSKLVFIPVLMFGAWTSVLGQDAVQGNASWLLVAPTNSVAAGKPVPLGVVLLNASSESLKRSLPSTLHGRLLAGTHRQDVSLRRDTAKPDESVELVAPPSGFARRDYVVELPAAISGLVVLEIPLLAARVALEVTAAPAPAEKSDVAKIVQQAQPPFSAADFFKEHISGYEPFYFIAGPESPNAKFQISLKYQLLSRHSALAAHAPALEGIHFAYSQTSLWDWNGPSAPFFDSSYRPELLYTWERLWGGRATNWYRLDLTGGVQHESNGKDELDSRSLNIVYFRPTFTLGKPDELQWTVSPRVWVYVGDLSDNPDMEDYRGYADLRMILGWARGVQLSTIGRLGDDGEHGSIQLDLTYPLMRLLAGSFSVYLHAQYFNGYGESLLLYNEKGSSWRLGFALFR